MAPHARCFLFFPLLMLRTMGQQQEACAAEANTRLAAPALLQKASRKSAVATLSEAAVDSSEVTSSAMLQMSSASSKINKIGGEQEPGEAEKAIFLMQATFGPTRQSLDELTNYEQWVTQQIALPASTHRDFFRAHSNPKSDPTNQVGFSERPRCAKGSRWYRHALTQKDEGLQVEITGSKKLKVEGKWRSDLDPTNAGNGVSPGACSNLVPAYWERRGTTCEKKASGGRCRGHLKTEGMCKATCFNLGEPFDNEDCSEGWAALGGFEGYVCSVTKTRVKLSTDSKCKKGLKFLTTPLLWMAEPSAELATELPFETNPRLPGLAWLADDAADCALGDLVSTGGVLYAYDARMALVENDLASPGDFEQPNCVPKDLFNAKTCAVRPMSEEGCALACGSPGEVANLPTGGHQYPFSTMDVREKPYYSDQEVDTRFQNTKGLMAVSKSRIWMERALKADDQLRQRMAWALSQIVVVGVTGGRDGGMSEFWMKFYDIFVRNAFGSYADILREVTYSPLMGGYLSYKNSKSYDSSKTYPDENYAREIMQLFTVGLFQLHPNGTAIKDGEGNSVPTYSNDQIMNFARVFTGFKGTQHRANIESYLGTSNMLDPMFIDASRHDRYPKPDLFGGYLGDGYPLCSDLPAQAFLEAGARYDFLGYDYDGDALVLAADSSLFTPLCNGAADACPFAASVSLAESLVAGCKGPECSARTVDVVQVGNGFYEYVAPACVHHFFFNGKLTKQVGSWRTQCASPHFPSAGVACAKGCKDVPNSWMKRKDIACADAHTKWTNKKGVPEMTAKYCNKKSSWRDRAFCELTCEQAGLGYGKDCSEGAYTESLSCQSSYEMATYSAAMAHCASMGMALAEDVEGSCSAGTYTWQNTDCALDVTVHADGKVSADTSYAEQNRFAVNWVGGTAPVAGVYPASVATQQAFDSLPSVEDLLARLTVGAYGKAGACFAGCSEGPVMAYGESGAVDEATVFEYNGRLYKNVEGVVHVAGGSFRNPPVFLASGPAQPSQRVQQRAAENEVESLIQHLVTHPATPGSICKRLVQRFVTSNPSAGYLAAVTAAFSTGSYEGQTFSGKYGDLGATVAAILLHPEARGQTGEDIGLLREPVLKIMHVLRSLEYSDIDGETPMIKAVDEQIGQFPYRSPSVFNYYNADFMPSRFRSGRSEPEPEPEPEPEEPYVAPEFQVFTPPTAMNWLNGMASILKNGVSVCEYGWALRDDQSGCKRGNMTAVLGADSDAVVGSLNLLLTGDRLSPKGLEAVKTAYEAASESERLEKAQQAILFTPEFNNLGNPKPDGARAVPAPAPEHAPADYKAIVLLFLHGGADTFHMLVPLCHLFNEYTDVRGGAAHKQGQLHEISSGPAQTCKKFGIHPELSFLANLYEKDKSAAFISNIGALVEPVTRADFKQKKRCRGMYSHSHQQSAAMTLDCTTAGSSLGVAGRMGDALVAQGMKVESFSVAGMARWSEGQDTKIEIVDKSKGAVRFHGYSEWDEIIGNITSQKYSNIYCEEYTQTFKEAVASSEKLGALLDSVNLKTAYPEEEALNMQLRQVAKLIETREDRRAERDFFFVQMGGFDTHAGLHETFAEKMRSIDGALSNFVAELREQGTFESTLLMTASDFGRTLTFNGAGTDHGWGGNHFILGGAVRGKQVLNEFPRTLVPENDYDAGRGRVIPEFPWESMFAPVAEWLGVADVDALFPNIQNFNRTRHIIAKDALFKA